MSRLGFLLHLDGDRPPGRAYREAIELFRIAEELGYDSGWVIQRHFRQGKEHVSAPLVLLAAIAEHTSRIGLGTGGVGSGPFPGAWEAFGRDLGERHRLFDATVARLHEVLDGVPLNSLGEVLHPQVSRAVYPHPDRAEAIRLVTPGVRRWQSWLSARRDVAELSVEEYLEADHALIGPPAELAVTLAADPALRHATDLLVSFVPGVPDFDEHVRLLTATARELVPAFQAR